MDCTNLRTVKQVAEMNPAFSEAAIRWMRFNAETNGFDRVLVKVGRRVLIDLAEFENWLEEGRVDNTASSASPTERF